MSCLVSQKIDPIGEFSITFPHTQCTSIHMCDFIQHFRAHPHKLVGKDICSKGVCTLEINKESMTAIFANLGIQCVKKKDIDESLKEREKIRVDPFRSEINLDI